MAGNSLSSLPLAHSTDGWNTSVEEKETQVFTPRPEDILSVKEAELLIQAGASELACPHCEAPLTARRRVTQAYRGIILSCPECGFSET